MILLYFFKLIRWQNLSMLVFIQILLKYVLFQNHQIITSLSCFDFTLLVTSIILIAAGGNVINDVLDTETDKINKPNKVLIGTIFSKVQAIIIYSLFTLLGIAIGTYLSFKMKSPILSLVFITISILLFSYSAYFKKIAVLGNLIVSLLISFSIVLLGIFDILPNIINPNNSLTFNVILVYALFAFGMNFIREIIKDIEDIDGDNSVKMKTLPIIFGRKRTKDLIFILSLLFTFSLIYILVLNRYLNDYLLSYGFIFITIPLLYFCYQLYKCSSKQELIKLSSLLKLIMVFGILSLIII